MYNMKFEKWIELIKNDELLFVNICLENGFHPLRIVDILFKVKVYYL